MQGFIHLNGTRFCEEFAFTGKLSGPVYRLRILVCAPTNAAVDEIARRVATKGIDDGCGSYLHPSTVRLASRGTPGAISTTTDVYEDDQIKVLLGLSVVERRDRVMQVGEAIKDNITALRSGQIKAGVSCKNMYFDKYDFESID